MTYALLDERQMLTRNKVASTSLGLTLGAVMISGWVADTWHPWGSSVAQAATVVWVGLTAMTVQSVWRGAYFTSLAQRRRMVLTMAGLAALLGAGLVRNAVQHRLTVWVNGHTGADFVWALGFGYLAVVVIAIALRTRNDRQELGSE